MTLSPPYFVLLSGRAVLKVTGADAESFLQGLFSCDVKKAREGHAMLGALLSPQGKFLFDFFVLKKGEDFYLDTQAHRAEELVRKLCMYRLRAAVEIGFCPQWQVAAYVGDVLPTVPSGVITARDDRHPQIGWRAYGEQPEFTAIPHGNMVDYETLRLTLGLPDGDRDAVADKTILLENGYDQMGGVDFTKGCYVGQEVTARSKHRGELRKYLCIVRASQPLPGLGAGVHAAGKAIGEMRSSQGMLGLALVRTDMLAAARRENQPITIAGLPVEITSPWWHDAA